MGRSVIRVSGFLRIFLGVLELTCFDVHGLFRFGTVVIRSDLFFKNTYAVLVTLVTKALASIPFETNVKSILKLSKNFHHEIE